MKALNISKARGALPALVEGVSATGASVVLLRYGKPAAMIVPVITGGAKTTPYPLRKTPIRVADDFDVPITGLWDAAGVAEAHVPPPAAHKPKGQKTAKRRKP